MAELEEIAAAVGISIVDEGLTDGGDADHLGNGANSTDVDTASKDPQVVAAISELEAMFDTRYTDQDPDYVKCKERAVSGSDPPCLTAFICRKQRDENRGGHRGGRGRYGGDRGWGGGRDQDRNRERGNWGYRDRGDYGDRRDRGDYGDRRDRGDYGDRRDRGDYGDRRDRGDYGDRRDRGDYGDGRDRGDYGDRRDRGDYGDRRDRGDSGDRRDRGDRREWGNNSRRGQGQRGGYHNSNRQNSDQGRDERPRGYGDYHHNNRPR